jgi:hypothetical protein
MAIIPFINVTFFIFISSSFNDELEIMIKIVKPDLGPIFNDSEFVGGGYELNQSQIGYFEKKLGRKFDLKKYVYDFSKNEVKNKKSFKKFIGLFYCFGFS